MYKVHIRPGWELENEGGTGLPARLLELLVAIRDTGTLAAAARRNGLSYRYAWGLLQQAAGVFGRPLSRASRGRGAQLTPIGERLVWADNRIRARLSPMLDSLATEIEAELERVVSTRQLPLRIEASHGFGVEALRRALSDAGLPLELRYRSPADALAALRAGSCDVAGMHLPLGRLEREVAAHYAARLDRGNDRIIHLAMRRQGLVVAPGNPRRIHGLQDLTRPGLRFIHRQPGSGTRLLLETMLAREGLRLQDIGACDVEELTHAAVAAYVASGLADVGMGLEPPARRYGLDFVPMATEHYFFVCHAATLEGDRLDGLLGVLRGAPFRHALGQLPGYDPSCCGQVETLPEAFASFR